MASEMGYCSHCNINDGKRENFPGMFHANGFATKAIHWDCVGTNFTLAELGICEPSPHRSGYCSDIGILHPGYSLSAGSDGDSDTEGGMSPERAIRLWGRGIKSRRSSGLPSRENSALTLTDSDNDNKSDEENEGAIAVIFHILVLNPLTFGRGTSFFSCVKQRSWKMKEDSSFRISPGKVEDNRGGLG
ncbi:teneurin-2-like protein [Willisornis vidua]|uniref:Teneurin-2-like protein n=1 Tax=Willisornis vidua TaxID=1566151 RepID=A0ABQ9CV44_9PASS|nr:teneurin-2-like protein [Willisornis vidua]